jgi:protein-arginine kinase activator protein McsA
MKLADQMMINICSDKETMKKEPELEMRLGVTCKDIPKNEFQEFIYKNYVIKMMDAKRENRGEEYRKIQDQFVSFGKGTYFQEEVLDLCRLITSGGYEMKDSALIDATIKKMDAINREDYLVAARYRDEVNILKKQRK